MGDKERALRRFVENLHDSGHIGPNVTEGLERRIDAALEEARQEAVVARFDRVGLDSPYGAGASVEADRG